MGLSQLTGLTIDHLRPLIYQPVDHHRVIVHGQRLPMHMFRIGRARVCPDCLGESNHCRMTWDLSVVTACPLHSCLLLEECPKCNEPITWRRLGVSVCLCGCDWRDARSTPIPSSETILARLIHNRFALIDAPKSKSAGNPLYDLDLPSLLEAVLFVAGHQQGRTDTSGFLTLPGRTTREIHRRLLRSFAVFETWPNNFHEFLHDMRSQRMRSKVARGLSGSFGSFYNDLYGSKLHCAPAIGLLKGGFELYMSEHWDGKFFPQTRWLKSRDIRRKYLSRDEACNALGVDSRMLDSLVSEGKIATKVNGTGESRSYLVEASSVRMEFCGHVSLEGASRFLGLTRDNVLRLIENSLLVPVRTPSIDNRNHWKLDRTVVQDFFTRIISQVKPLRSYSNLELESFANALRVMNRQLSSSAQGIHNFVNDILSGEISPRGESCREVGISRLLFCRKEFKEYVRRKNEDQSDCGFRLRGKAKEFRLSKELIYFLARKGLIESNQSLEGDRVFKAISPKAVESFQSRYVFAFEMARALSIPTKVLLRELQRLEIEPVSGPSMDYGPHYVFKRTEIDRLDLKNSTDSSCRKVQERRDSISVDVNEAANILAVREKTISDLVKRDVLRPYRDSLISPKGYRFNRRYIEGFQGQFKNLDNLTTTDAAAKMLGRYHLRTKWLGMGFIKYEISKDGKRRFINNLDVENIASFSARVVTRSKAARLLEMNVNSMGYWIRKGTLRPVSHRYSRAFKYPLFSKIEVARFKALVSGVKA